MGFRETLRSHLTRLRQPSRAEISRAIRRAFRHDADEDAAEVFVEVSGHTVILRGTVSSWYEREDAERVAANAPGTRGVINEITIRA